MSLSNEILIQIEHCINCQSHLWCSRHDQSKYLEYYQKLVSTISKTIRETNVQPIFRQNQIPTNLQMHQDSPNNKTKYYNKDSGTIVTFPKIGSFEIKVQGLLIFSKLAQKEWPHFEKIANIVKEIIDCKNNGLSLDHFNILHRDPEKSFRVRNNIKINSKEYEKGYSKGKVFTQSNSLNLKVKDKNNSTTNKNSYSRRQSRNPEVYLHEFQHFQDFDNKQFYRKRQELNAHPPNWVNKINMARNKLQQFNLNHPDKTSKAVGIYLQPIFRRQTLPKRQKGEESYYNGAKRRKLIIKEENDDLLQEEQYKDYFEETQQKLDESKITKPKIQSNLKEQNQKKQIQKKVQKESNKQKEQTSKKTSQIQSNINQQKKIQEKININTGKKNEKDKVKQDESTYLWQGKFKDGKFNIQGIIPKQNIEKQNKQTSIKQQKKIQEPIKFSIKKKQQVIKQTKQEKSKRKTQEKRQISALSLNWVAIYHNEKYVLKLVDQNQKDMKKSENTVKQEKTILSNSKIKESSITGEKDNKIQIKKSQIKQNKKEEKQEREKKEIVKLSNKKENLVEQKQQQRSKIEWNGLYKEKQFEIQQIQGAEKNQKSSAKEVNDFKNQNKKELIEKDIKWQAIYKKGHFQLLVG